MTRRSPTRRLPTIEVDVLVVEELGSESHVIFPIDAAPVDADSVRAATDEGDQAILVADDRRSRFTAAVDERLQRAARDADEAGLDPARFHFFDVESGATRSATAGWPRPDQPYRSATARICCAPASIAASTNSPLPSVPMPAVRRSTVARARVRPRRRSAGTHVRSPRADRDGWQRGPRWPSGAAAPARLGEPVEVADVRVDRLRRPWQAGGDRGVDDAAAGPVETGLERTGRGA